MKHLLDNPAWNALISGNRSASHGNSVVKYFDIEIAPFVAFDQCTTKHFHNLHGLIRHDKSIIFITPGEIEIPDLWIVKSIIRGQQMVYNGPAPGFSKKNDLVALTKEHVPQMLALTKLTQPGPFAKRTIELGHYFGIFEKDRLVAMAGQRMHIFNYAEISAVCTHPDFTGRGYGRELILHQIQRIKAASEIPILHVKMDNERAIGVYTNLGFSTRTEINFYVLKKNDRKS